MLIKHSCLNNIILSLNSVKTFRENSNRPPNFSTFRFENQIFFNCSIYCFHVPVTMELDFVCKHYHAHRTWRQGFSANRKASAPCWPLEGGEKVTSVGSIF